MPNLVYITLTLHPTTFTNSDKLCITLQDSPEEDPTTQPRFPNHHQGRPNNQKTSPPYFPKRSPNQGRPNNQKTSPPYFPPRSPNQGRPNWQEEQGPPGNPQPPPRFRQKGSARSKCDFDCSESLIAALNCIASCNKG